LLEQGRDWERYAYVKARAVVGEAEAAGLFDEVLRPFVYRRYLDFGVFESLRAMKAMINAQMKHKRMTNNIKLGSGGVREIEFIGQTLQLIRAGRLLDLREGSIVQVDEVIRCTELSANRSSRKTDNSLLVFAKAGESFADAARYADSCITG